LGKRFSRTVQISVLLMILGAAIAAAGDLKVDLEGYTLIFLNDLFTALTSVVTRRVLDKNSVELGTHGVLFYNSAIAAPGALVLLLLRPDEMREIAAFPHWSSPAFLICFACSMLLGFVLNVVYFLCNKINSPLTTAVVGSMKNVLSAYFGMFFKDYVFTWVNFIGVNVAVVATLIYSYEEVLKAKAAGSQQQQARKQ
jgi:drug/metabolite transporter (DMT)-like permease